MTRTFTPSPPVSQQIFGKHFKPIYDDAFDDLLSELEKIADAAVPKKP